MNGDGESEFLHRLSDQTGLEALSGLALAAWKLPEATQMDIPPAAGNQDLPTPDNQARGDLNLQGRLSH